MSKENVRTYLKELYSLFLSGSSTEGSYYKPFASLLETAFKGELLKYEFPRIPFPEKLNELRKFSKIGKRVVELHLLKNISPVSIKLVGENFKVENVKYRNDRLYINNTTYFEPVEKETFGYRIGGYQVLKKWLSDRKGRELSFEEINTFRKMVLAVKETIKITGGCHGE